jgi:hypothetical protein
MILTERVKNIIVQPAQEWRVIWSTGGGKRAPEGWGGGLKSDSRTIEQKLDTP